MASPPGSGKDENLKEALLCQGLKENDVVFILEKGHKFVNHPETLAQKLSLNNLQAKEALDELKKYKNNQISKEEIKSFEQLVMENPNEGLKEIALLNDIDENVISAYLEYTETRPIIESQHLVIKERINAGLSVQEIADELRISQIKVGKHVESKLMTFCGVEGQRALGIITKHFGSYPIAKLRELIVTKNLKLQEQICCRLPEINERECRYLKQYFMKFEESENFFEINETLSIEAKERIRASSLDDLEELSKRLNRIQRVIGDYLLQYFPDEPLMLYYTEEQIKNIQKIMAAFEIDERISHTTYRMIISDSFENIIQNASKPEKRSKMILDELLPLTFYYLKCSLPLKEISQLIAKITKMSLTTLDLFHLIFQMSDPIVKGLCIEHYSFSNPVPFYYPLLEPFHQMQNTYQFDICRELWYSLQQFNGLVSFGLGWASWNPIGKSHLLDLLFETDFVNGSPQSSAFHFGSIDIQLTKNLFGNKEKNIHEPTQWAYIDCHGCSDFNVVMEICQNLDVALIHVNFSDFEENYFRLEQDLIKLTGKTQHVYLLVRDYTGNAIEKMQDLLGGKLCTIVFIPHLTRYNTDMGPDLKQLGYSILHSTTDSVRFVDSIFLEHLMREFEIESNLENDRGLIQIIMNHIFTKDENKKDYCSLSYYPHFIEYMRCYYNASSETEQKVIDMLNKRCEILDKLLNGVKMSEITLYFNDIISQRNSTLILWKLSQELRTEKCTLEVLWREALLSYKYDSINEDEPSKFAKEFASNFSNHVARGEPFELIDGDNLRFFNQDIDSLLSDLYDTQSQVPSTINNKSKVKRPPIVISIFGPQSSGKSTLLNYCFGCKFLTSAGRCTKGVYGSLSKLSQPINHSDHFLILDTEGLDAIEKGNVLTETSCIHFDRTMVLFCLAVSQIAIINVRGEIGEELRNLLQICAYSLNKLKVSKVAAPKIFFVLNQQADPDPNKHLSSINTLLEDLNKESYLMETEGMTISDLIQVSRENLFVLPSAFNSVCVNTQMAKLFDSDLNKLSPTVSFANKCADLRMSIIHQLKGDNTPDDQTPFTTMSEWMEMSGVIWDTIVKYQDIVKYRNVEELKCSVMLSKIVNDLLKNKIYFYKEAYQLITEKLIKIIRKITSWNPPQGILEDVKIELDEIFTKYQEEALTEFTELCRADPLLKKMIHMCDDAKSNLCRLIYMEKKIYEDKLRFEIKARLSEIKRSEKMLKFQKDIERNADIYLELNIEQQKSEFDKIWIDCFDRDNLVGEESEWDDIFDNLYSMFRMESKTMENKQTIYTQFRDANFDMDNVIQTLRKEILTKFCDETNSFLYPWKENKVPLKQMTPYTGKERCEYLTKESLWKPPEANTKRRRNRNRKLRFQKWVPSSCHSLIQYCSGYYNHPDIIWNPEKRKQIILLASQLRDPNNYESSTWRNFINKVAARVEEFIKKDPSISHSTVKEIVNFLCNICKVVNYEINFIEARLTNAAERTISTFAFAFTFKSLLESKTSKQREDKLEESKKKKNNLRYFLQKVENRKMARGNWDRKEMRKGDQTIANKFAGDLLESMWRGVNTRCEQNIKEEYFDEKIDTLSHKSLLFLANKKINKELNKLLEFHPISFDNFVVQFICNQTQEMKKLFQEEWMKVAKQLYDRIVGNMKAKFTKQISTIYHVLTKLLDGLVTLCATSKRPEGIGLDSDSNFVVSGKTGTRETSGNPNPRTKEAPFKSMVLFLEMYLNPKVSPMEFNQFFSDTFQLDGVKMRKNHDVYVLCEKPDIPTAILDEELFKKLTDTKMFSNSETIFNIKVYIEEFVRVLSCYEFQVTPADYGKLLKATKEQFESRVINCPYQCPSCGKYCEREIHPHAGKCRILTGHQICSMGGKVWNTNKDRTAILLMCDDYKNNSPVLIPGQDMRWWEFKEKCGDQWDWSLPRGDNYVALQKENRQKMKKIWNKFGRKILQFYANKGTQINYIPYTSSKEIYESLFRLNYFVCFVIDGTDLMGGTIKYVRHWVSDLMSGLEGASHFKVIVYHSDCSSPLNLEIFPNTSDFTSEEKRINLFLKSIDIYGDDDDGFAMLHGLATATKGSTWGTGFGVRNNIVHIYIEPTQGHFDIFTAKGKCPHGCRFNWKRDISDVMEQYKIEYKRERLICSNHPDFHDNSVTPVDYKIRNFNLNSKEECKSISQIFINCKPDS